ncbi:MAG TPA: hypothetical protein VKY89_16620 [Thermoanaerobaculia bacterium]|jgi:hypothetical protein|nr:hypothetical protein [Thermoanaerobaculia bacterium]
MLPTVATATRAARPCLAAALTLASLLTAAPVRSDPGPRTHPQSVAAVAAPTCQWLRLLLPDLDRWLPASREGRQSPRPAARTSDTPSQPGTAPPCPNSGPTPGCQSGGGTDPNG